MGLIYRNRNLNARCAAHNNTQSPEEAKAYARFVSLYINIALNNIRRYKESLSSSRNDAALNNIRIRRYKESLSSSRNDAIKGMMIMDGANDGVVLKEL